MADYKKMYHILFDETAKVIEQLQEAHQKAEEVYIEGKDAPLSLAREDAPNGK